MLAKTMTFDGNTVEYLCYTSATGTQHTTNCRAVEATP